MTVPLAHDPITDACVVIAAYNEAQVLGQVVLEARRHFANVVVVDDGSRDETAAVASSAGAMVVRHPVNLGQGAALLTGTRHALDRVRPAYVVTFDADGQRRHRPAQQEAEGRAPAAHQHDPRAGQGCQEQELDDHAGARRRSNSTS